MFYQVRIRPADQDSLRFLWRNGDTSAPMETYVMKVMMFGTRYSPCSAQFVKNLNAAEHAHVDAIAADAITNHHYVDDYVISFDTPDEASKTTKAVIDIHQRGGFTLRNFRSNSRAVLQDLGCAENNDPVSLQMDTAEQEKV